MKIKTFTAEDEANQFIDTVKVISLEHQRRENCPDKIVVIYAETLTPETTRLKKIHEDEQEALNGIEDAKMHLQYLEIIAAQSEEDAKIVEGSIKGTKQNIKNFEAKLKAIELWKSE